MTKIKLNSLDNKLDSQNNINSKQNEVNID